MKQGLISWIVSALVLWLLSLINWMGITFGGTGFSFIITIIIVAVVVGLINAIIVPVVKGVFKKGHPAVLFCISLLIDAAALWLAHWLLGDRFGFTHFSRAIIAAAVLALVNVGVGFTKE